MFSGFNTYFCVVSVCSRYISLIVVSVLERHPKRNLWDENRAIWLLGVAKQRLCISQDFRMFFFTAVTNRGFVSSPTYKTPFIVQQTIRGRWSALLQCLDIRRHNYKNKEGIPPHKAKRSCWNKGRRRRAGPELWFEVILSHEGTSSSSSPSGKTDRVQPHEDSSALPVILPKTADIQRGKNTFHESYVRKPYHSVSYCLYLKFLCFDGLKWLNGQNVFKLYFTCLEFPFWLFFLHASKG